MICYYDTLLQSTTLLLPTVIVHYCGPCQSSLGIAKDPGEAIISVITNFDFRWLMSSDMGNVTLSQVKALEKIIRREKVLKVTTNSNW